MCQAVGTQSVLQYARSMRGELSFKGERLLRGRHRIHPYPAMLHPLLVDFLIDTYAEKCSVILDPFCGSGVTLLQSQLRGHESIGFDINPVALLIARAKTRQYAPAQLQKESRDFGERLQNCAMSLFAAGVEPDIPEIKNMDYWYSEPVIRDLGRIRSILKNNSYEYKDFFLTVFAFVCRNQSWTRNGEFKRYRIRKSKLGQTRNEVFVRFCAHMDEMTRVFLENAPIRKPSTPMLHNSEQPIPTDLQYDTVITSPPYGDSRTTVAYGQYTSFGSDWLRDLIDGTVTGYRVDTECLGKRGDLVPGLKDHDILQNTIHDIGQRDFKRATEVLHFFNGYYRSILNVASRLNSGGTVCYVVGNRTVKGIQIPMDQITASFLEATGMSFQGIFTREISNKVMPLKNSPTNKAGATSPTMLSEYIVVFSKPKL